VSKKFCLALFVLALMAAPAFAQDGDSGPSEESIGTESHGGPGGFDDSRGGRGGRGNHGGGGGGGGNFTGDRPVAPVPEPGTMALASMGLIALGVAARGRKS
jgi:hypothetical protein